MTLIEEPRGERDVAERQVRAREFMTNRSDAAFAHVITERAAVGAVKLAREVDRMHLDCLGDLNERQAFAKPFINDVSRPLEPEQNSRP